MDIHRSSLSLRQLHYLVAVADAGSFCAAAQTTHVAQPALSRQVAALEAEVGLRLLERSRRGVTLTESGVRLYSLARSILERLDGIGAELRSSERQPTGLVNIALPASLASLLVPQLVRELAARHPQIVLRVEDGLSLENGRSLEAALLDFGIIPAADELVDVVYEPLVREALLFIEGGPPKRRPSATIAFRHVARQPLVLPPRSFHTRRCIDAAAAIARVQLNIAYEQRSVSTIASLVREGLGATITNSPAVEQLWPPGTVTVRRIVRPALTRTIALARPAKRPLSFAAQAVYAIVQRCALDAVTSGRWDGTPLRAAGTPLLATGTPSPAERTPGA